MELVTSTDQVRDMLDFLQARLDCCLVIDGESLQARCQLTQSRSPADMPQLCLDQFRAEFVMLATELSAVVACRCSPTQKADVARLIREYSKKIVCCIGDGGNDVSMIQAADVGVGIVGKEGKQASLAADFSITQFSFLTKLLLWHGRNSYNRSAKLSQFVIHRGLIIAVIQAVFSSIFFFAPIALYQGWLQVGYATLYTMAPVFSLVLDRDVSEDLALLYPELYKELTKVGRSEPSSLSWKATDMTQGRSLSYKTFFTWLTISVYQGQLSFPFFAQRADQVLAGGIIMLLSLLLFESEFLHIVAISFTALVINELIMVALEITTWHTYMLLSELGTALVYFGSMAFLPAYFGETTAFSVKSKRADHILRPLLCALHDVHLQGRSDHRRVLFPTVRHKGLPPTIQTGSVHQSPGYLNYLDNRWTLMHLVVLSMIWCPLRS